MTTSPVSAHLEVSKNLHFQMVRLTNQNITTWREFALSQRFRLESHSSSRQNVRKADKGIKAFLETIEFYNRHKTEVWVAFASDRPLCLADEPDHAAIEMWMSLVTSDSAKFTGHMGITRSVSYVGVSHPALACALHGFLAAAALRIFADKLAMISVPASRMREILVNNFQESGNVGDVFIGDGSGRIRLGHSIIDIDALPLEERLKQRRSILAKMPSQSDDELPSYETNELAISVQRQNLYWNSGGRSLSVHMTRDELDRCLTFSLFGKDGLCLHNFTNDNMFGEFAWFFENPYFVQNPRQPIVAVDLNILAELAKSGRWTVD